MPKADPTTPDQVRLRAVAQRIRKLMEDENLGGVCVLVSPNSAEWATVIPTWADVAMEPEGVRIRMLVSDPQRSDRTMHFVGSIRDICLDYGKLMGSVWDAVLATITKTGGTISHTPFSGIGHGPSGKTQN